MSGQRQAVAAERDAGGLGARWLLIGLVAAVMASAVAVVYARHLNRTLFAELQQHQQQRDALNVRWGQLQLEQGTWDTHSRIERVARERLNMIQPAPGDVVIVRAR